MLCLRLSHTCFSSKVHEVSKSGPDSQFWTWWLSMGGKGALNLLPIVPKAFVYVPKVMHKTVMGGNTMSDTFTHMFHFQSVWSFENWPRQSIWSVMAEYGREWCVELSSHCAQSLHICPKGNAQTSYGWYHHVWDFHTHVSLLKCVQFRKLAQMVNLKRDGWVWEGMVRWIIFPLCPKPPYMFQR